jgi:HD-like signal output (HDOD) protein
LRRHSIASASLAQHIAQIHHSELAIDAFIAALLHDMGRVLQARLDPDGFALMRLALDRAQQTLSHSEMRTIEAMHIGIGHDQCMEIVFRHWNLPESLAVAVGYHHDPMAASESHRSLAAITHLSNSLLANDREDGFSDLLVQETCAEAQKWLGIRDEELAVAISASNSNRSGWEAGLGQA